MQISLAKCKWKCILPACKSNKIENVGLLLALKSPLLKTKQTDHTAKNLLKLLLSSEKNCLKRDLTVLT